MICVRVKHLFGSLETPISRIQLAAGKQIPGVKDTEMWFGEYQFFWQFSQPTPQCSLITTLVVSTKLILNQVRRPFEIFAAQCMIYGLIDEPFLLVPLAGPAVQNWQSFWLGLVQTLPQQISKEMVIAVPTPFVVQGDDEQVGVF